MIQTKRKLETQAPTTINGIDSLEHSNDGEVAINNQSEITVCCTDKTVITVCVLKGI